MENSPTQHSNAYKVALGLFVGLLLLPLFQELTQLFPERELLGVENPTGKVEWSWATWQNGSYQSNFEQRHYQWMGLRSSLVRMENQLDYSLFGRLFDQTRVGKSGELFRRTSFEAVTGRDFIGEEQVNYQANHVTYLQQFLLQKGIRLLPVLTPTKLRCMPEELSKEALQKVGPTNYRTYLEAFAKYKLDFLDLTSFFLQAVQADPHRVFPKTGSHWTDYGAALGFREIVRKMEQITGQEHPDFSMTEFEQLITMRGTDADAGDILNLWTDFPAAAVDYPILNFSQDSNSIRPKVLVISDSFWWKIYDQKLHQRTFAAGSQFRYYNWEVYSDEWEGNRFKNDFDLRQSIESVQWILLCANEGNLHKFPFDFADEALEAYGVLQ